jgi:hypothetical protein
LLKWTIILWVLVVAAPSDGADAFRDPRGTRTCLTLSYFPPPSSQERMLELGLSVFREAGLCVHLVPVPARRSRQMMVSGKIDGQLMRTLVWAQQHRHSVVSVPTPIVVNKMMAVSLKKNGYLLKVMDDLMGLRVLIFEGHRWAEAELAKRSIQPAHASSIVRFIERMRFREVDVGLMENAVLGRLQEQPDFALQSVADVPYHLVLHIKHARYIGALDEAIERIASK